jgi:hypothetical protein
MFVNYEINIPEKTMSNIVEFLERENVLVSPKKNALHVFTIDYDKKEKLELFKEFEKLLIDEFLKLNSRKETDKYNKTKKDFTIGSFISNGDEILAEYLPSDEMIMLSQILFLMCKYLGLGIINNEKEKYYFNIGNHNSDINEKIITINEKMKSSNLFDGDFSLNE